MEYGQQVDGPKSQWHHAKVQAYQYRMKRSPTRAERRFDDILDSALKGLSLPSYKPTQVHKRGPKRKFKKQRIFEDQRHHKAYIADFYVPDLKLVFEIDGDSHNNTHQHKYDINRSSFLATRGILVVRIKNEETLQPSTLIPKLIDIIELRFNTIQKKDQLRYDPRFQRYLNGYR